MLCAAPDARLQHAAAPHGNAAFLRRIVHRDGFGKSAHAAELDVDDLARLHLDRRQRIATVANGFIEADRRIRALLQHGVVVEVVVPEWLLDHEQIKLIEGREVVGVA